MARHSKKGFGLSFTSKKTLALGICSLIAALSGWTVLAAAASAEEAAECTQPDEEATNECSLEFSATTGDAGDGGNAGEGGASGNVSGGNGEGGSGGGGGDGADGGGQGGGGGGGGSAGGTGDFAGATSDGPSLRSTSATASATSIAGGGSGSSSGAAAGTSVDTAPLPAITLGAQQEEIIQAEDSSSDSECGSGCAGSIVLETVPRGSLTQDSPKKASSPTPVILLTAGVLIAIALSARTLGARARHKEAI